MGQFVSPFPSCISPPLPTHGTSAFCFVFRLISMPGFEGSPTSCLAPYCKKLRLIFNRLPRGSLLGNSEDSELGKWSEGCKDFKHV